MTTLSIILAVVIVTSFFIIRNLLKQIEKLEDIQTEYEKFINKQSDAINASCIFFISDQNHPISSSLSNIPLLS